MTKEYFTTVDRFDDLPDGGEVELLVKHSRTRPHKHDAGKERRDLPVSPMTYLMHISWPKGRYEFLGQEPVIIEKSLLEALGSKG